MDRQQLPEGLGILLPEGGAPRVRGRSPGGEAIGHGIRALTLAAGLAALALAGAAGCSPTPAKYPEYRAVEGSVTVDVRDVAAGSGVFLTYRADSGRMADFFVYRERNGRPRAVLDACRTCYRWKKGYRLEGDTVVCVYCGMRFELDGLAGGIGSCVPIPLPSTREGERLVIPAGELEAGLRYF